MLLQDLFGKLEFRIFYVDVTETVEARAPQEHLFFGGTVQLKVSLVSLQCEREFPLTRRFFNLSLLIGPFIRYNLSDAFHL